MIQLEKASIIKLVYYQIITLNQGLLEQFHGFCDLVFIAFWILLASSPTIFPTRVVSVTTWVN